MRGFTILELLVAMTIVLLIAGALAAVAAPARQTFDTVPAELDLQQRGRTAIDAITQQLRSSLVVSGDQHKLTVAVPTAQGGQGLLIVDQAGESAPIALATSGCPNIADVCGFTSGTTAIIRNAAGQSDTFTILATSAAARTLTPDHALSRLYHADDVVTAVDTYSFSLEAQADGSFTLIRETAAGAIQPIVDLVSDLSFAIAAPRIGLSIRVHPTASMRVPPRVFTASVALRNAHD